MRPFTHLPVLICGSYVPTTFSGSMARMKKAQYCAGCESTTRKGKRLYTHGGTDQWAFVFPLKDAPASPGVVCLKQNDGNYYVGTWAKPPQEVTDDWISEKCTYAVVGPLQQQAFDENASSPLTICGKLFQVGLRNDFDACLHLHLLHCLGLCMLHAMIVVVLFCVTLTYSFIALLSVEACSQTRRRGPA